MRFLFSDNRPRGFRAQGAAQRPVTDVVAQHVEIEARLGAPVTAGGEGARDTRSKVFRAPSAVNFFRFRRLTG
ncbi:hypothetical protein CRT23_14485 [Methylobacterium sp. V23]|nr:hypothetical protein CRT23_14485 [Methylobacterium sp. V23]